MLRVNTADGLTAKFDLQDEDQARALLTRARDRAYQQAVRAVTAVQRARDDTEFQCALVRPTGFRDVFFDFEVVESDGAGCRGGEKVGIQADDVRVVLTVHRERPSVRVDLLKVGRRRYNPHAG